MEIEVRGETTAINEYMCEKAEKVLQNCAQMYDCEMEIKLMGAAEAIVPDETLAKRIGDVCRKMGLEVQDGLVSVGGSEDLSYMINRVMEHGGHATMFREITDTAAPAHNRRFDFNEAALVTGVAAFVGCVYDILK